MPPVEPTGPKSAAYVPVCGDPELTDVNPVFPNCVQPEKSPVSKSPFSTAAIDGGAQPTASAKVAPNNQAFITRFPSRLPRRHHADVDPLGKLQYVVCNEVVVTCAPRFSDDTDRA